MGKIPDLLRQTIAKNIRECRMKKFPGRGGGKKCAEAFGVSPQQWSPWERGMRTPDEDRMIAIAKFFGVTVPFLREDHSPATQENQPCTHPPATGQPRYPTPNAGPIPMPPALPPRAGSGEVYWLLAKFFGDMVERGVTIRLPREDMDYFCDRMAEALGRHGAIPDSDR